MKLLELINEALDNHWGFEPEVKEFFDTLRKHLLQNGWIDKSRVMKNVHKQTFDAFEMETKERSEIFDKPALSIRSNPHDIKDAFGEFKVKIQMFNSVGSWVRASLLADRIKKLGYKAVPTKDGVSITIPLKELDKYADD